MARAKSKNQTQKVHPTISEQTARYFDDLIAIGSYGNSHAEVAAYLIQRGIDDLLRAQVLEKKNRPSAESKRYFRERP